MHIFIYLPLYPSILPSIYLFIYPLMYLEYVATYTIYLSTHLNVKFIFILYIPFMYICTFYLAVIYVIY